MLENEATSGSVLADTVDLGEAELFVALMIGGNVSEAYRVRFWEEAAASGINAVVVPSQLDLYMTKKLHGILGVDCSVYLLGFHQQPYGGSNTKRLIKIGSGETTGPSQMPTRHQDSEGSGREAFIGDDLLGTNSDDAWQNLSRRMIQDEGHSLRHFDDTLRGLNARRFAPKYRHMVTGTPIIRTVRDFRGYVALVERSDWFRSDIGRSEGRDGNGNLREDGRTAGTAKGQSLQERGPPARRDPFDKNKARCLTVQAFNVWIEPHLRRWEKHQDRISLSIASHRLRIIYHILFVSRNSQTVVRLANGENAAEMQWYREYEQALGQEVNGNLGGEQDETGITMADLYPFDYLSAGAEGGEAPAVVHPERPSHYRTTIIPMVSHLGTFALRKRSTPQWALGLHEEDDAFISDVVVLEQALRGAPLLAKTLVDVWDIIENAPPESNKVINCCTSPRSVEVLNKILRWVSISTAVLRSTDDSDYRNKLMTAQFNKEADSHHVLLAPLTFRIVRSGQLFLRYYVPGTYHADMEKTMLGRVLQIKMVTNDYLHARNEHNGRVFSQGNDC
ncbi:hypothetical protein KC345_g7243 [Hortaea werneckii]|nr:hypothetical protein KC345_g7243 [Hortaea werneckii]